MASGFFSMLLRALRDDEAACAALGKNVVRFRLTAFVLGAMLMGLSGALYAGYSWSALGAGPTFLIASAGAALAAFIIAKRLKETPHSAPPV